MSHTPSHAPLSQAVGHTFRHVRRLLTRYIVVQSGLLITLWLLLVFWLGGMLDYLPVRVGSSETPRWVRAGLLGAMVLGGAYIGLRWMLTRWLARVPDSGLALLIERHYPELNNQLITAVELSQRPVEGVSNPAAHELMLQRVQRSAAAYMPRVQPVELFNWQPLWGLGVAAALGLTVTAIAAFGMSDWTGRWARRLFALSDEPWPRQASLRADGLVLSIPSFSTQVAAERMLLPFEEGLVRVPHGAAPQLQISADASAPQLPEVCTLFYRSSDGERGRANLRRIGSPRQSWQLFTLDGPPLDGITGDLSLDVRGLDARLRDLRIEVVQPAVVANMQMECVYPGYLLDSLSVRGSREVLDYRSGVALPEGTQVTLVGTASSPLSRVEYLIHAPSEEEANPPQILSSSPQGERFELPLGRLDQSAVVEVRLFDHFGLAADQIPRYVVTIREDTVPEVSTQLEGIGLAVTPVARLPLVGSVVDDHGIDRVTAELALEDQSPLEIPLALEGQRLDTALDLEQLQATQPWSLEPGASLQVVVMARDHYDLGESPHIGRGQSVQLAVVTADQLLVMLDRQELELRQRLELIVSELEQLHEVLQTMQSDLPAAESRIRTPQASSPRVMWVALQSAPASETPAQLAQRLAGLWAQQAVLQADKSQQELSSVAARVDNLRLQLVNNRIDSYDRQQRLEEKVGQPLRSMLADQYETFRRSVAQLQTAVLAGGGRQPAAESAEALQRVLEQLEAIKANMQDIEDFNEIVDLVRGLLEDQEQVLNQTEAEQRRRILDLLR